MRMRDVKSAVFKATVEKAFVFLLENGLPVSRGSRTDTSLPPAFKSSVVLLAPVMAVA
jgi:hypothetical protein